MMKEWEVITYHSNAQQIHKAIDICAVTMAWPPSLCELMDICDKLAGVPSIEEIKRAGINRDFSNPIVKLIFDKITSHNFSGDTDMVLKSKIKNALDDIRTSKRLKLLNYDITEPLIEIKNESEPVKQAETKRSGMPANFKEMIKNSGIKIIGDRK